MGRRRASVSAKRISDLIGAIYDCVLNPGKWTATLESINREFSFASSVLGVVPLRTDGQVAMVSAGMDAEWLDVGGRYANESIALWGGAERAQQFPLDEPIIGSQAAGYADRHTNRYFLDVLEPRGMFDAVLITVAREPLLLGYAAFNRHLSAGDIGEAEIEGLRLLGPHFRRAVTISNLFDMKAIEAATFRATVDAMSFGVVLVDETLGVVHANPAGEAMLKNGDPIGLQDHALTVAAKLSSEALRAAVQQAAQDEGAMGQRGIGIPLQRRTGAPCVVHVLPLQKGEARSGLVQSAVAALFIVPTNTPARMPTDALALLYNLTPAEVRVFELICAGKTPTEIADELGVARSTVKTHLLHVFGKTGCKRQADLLRLAADLAMPG